MSDYLSNVVARGLNLREVIRPRLAGLFEPPAGAGGTVAEPPLGIENRKAPAVLDNATAGATLPDRLEPNQPVAHPPRGRSPAAPPPAAHPPSPITSSDALPGDIPGTPGHRRVQGQGGLRRPLVIEGSEVVNPGSRINGAAGRSVPGRLPKGQPANDSPRPALNPVAERVEVEHPNEPEQALPPVVTGDTRATRDPSTAPTRGRPPKRSTQHVLVERPAARAEPSPPTIGRVEPTLTRAAHTVMVQPHVASYVNPAVPASIEPLDAPQPAPTIQVTIGRIEVRATPPSALPQSKRLTPPVMSLDEYLSQRAREGRDR